ncbi:MAG TPA: hypothetical protein VIJ54_00335 [Actinomycetes bacterium]
MASTGPQRRVDVVHRGYRALLLPKEAARHPSADPHELHVDEDLICPRCLQWIEPGDFVRQTRIGLRQHEAC